MEYSGIYPATAIIIKVFVMLFHKVKDIKPVEDYCLMVVFENNEVKKYDVSKLFYKYPVFMALKTINGLFKQVKVDKGGYGISWNDELDISCNELYYNSCVD